MSDNFQSCPGCQSLILTDTPSCPECGHTFKEGSAAPTTTSLERSATVHQRCPKCGDEVPAGLVRCWSCNTFMREDVAEKYKSLVDNPQKIIFSDVPPGERTETIPPRSTRGGYARILDAEDDDEFTLQGQQAEDDEFELKPDSGDAATVATAAESGGHAAAAPQSAAESETDDESTDAKPETTDSQSAEPTGSDETSVAGGSTANAPPQANADDLLSIALNQEKEADVRKRQRRAAMNRKRILIPCPSCGVWLRVREEQAGKSVRCRSCQTGVPVPPIRRKEKKAPEPQAPEVVLDWIEDIHVHLIVPTDISLKPGSLQDTYQSADATFDSEGLHLTVLGGSPKKKSLFSRGSSDDLPQKRSENREHISKSGGVAGLPHGELYSVPMDALSSIRLVQPVRQAHESMFAGVPVFGEGRIVVYLPVQLEGAQQLYCSMPLTLWRHFSERLKQVGIDLPAKENGVPESEIHVSPLCNYTQAKIESIRELAYYQNDSAFELELSGYRCAACGIAVSEAARAKNKLGGAAGKTIARAKCPKCSAKFGNEPLYRISRAPESLESGEDESASPG